MKADKFSFQKIAFVGNYIPRRCGIATFTTDLCEAIAREVPTTNCVAAAMNDTPEGYSYPDRVRFEIAQNDVDQYRQLADFLNMGQVDLACIQHEYGIFGGLAGSYLLIAVRRLRMPIVTTLHTVLKHPDEAQKQVLIELCSLSERVVVMSQRSAEFLQEIYAVPAGRIDLIHHGIPDMPFVDPNYYKDLFGVDGRRVILTFGLLSPNKGIEFMINALPDIIRRFPDVVYLVLGVTHPNVKREKGEEYRLGLQRLARDIGVADNVVFHNRFVDIDELCRFLGAADLYVTPYLVMEQSVSGTLAYSLGTGKAIVSTPYWYAEELLDKRRGQLVPFRDAGALASASIELLESEAERHAMRKRAYAFGRMMVWKEVARQYLQTFERASQERLISHARPSLTHTADMLDIDLPELNLSHVLTLTDDTGILQHARRTVPNLAEGYTTDDNARALIAVLRAQQVDQDSEALRRLATRYLAFLDYALNRENGLFRNYLGYDRRWTEPAGSEDAHGRALWSLGSTVGASKDDGIVALAMNLFEAGLAAVETFSSPRAWAFSLLGICSFIKRFPGASEARRFRDSIAARLLQLYQANAHEEWPWFEQSLAYENARLSQALLRAASEMENQEMAEAGLKSLGWLVQVQTAPEGHFVPIAHVGWHRTAERARFDQQPVEAQSTIEACFRAYRMTGERRWREWMARAFEWFLGRNDLGLPLYDYATGGCHDGLHPEGVNANEGAESTLALICSLLTMRVVATMSEDVST
ncbi:MAG: glycosyltransferase family 4 protein [Candidatus Aminicenantales bacterium]